MATMVTHHDKMGKMYGKHFVTNETLNGVSENALVCLILAWKINLKMNSDNDVPVPVAWQ